MARVVAQWTYDAYGAVLTAEHLDGYTLDAAPHLGHKGLFFDRLDASVTAPRLVPFAHALYHARNRVYQPRLACWNQSDPNATGLALLEYAAFHGEVLPVRVSELDLPGLYGDGGNLYEYLGSSTWGRSDALGLWFWEVIEADWEMKKRGLQFLAGAADPGGIAGSMLKQMGTQYAANLDWDVEWALDWSLPDDWHTRGSSRWVEVAMIIGAADHFGIDFSSFSSPFGGPAMASGVSGGSLLPRQLANKSGTLKVLNATERASIAAGAVAKAKVNKASASGKGGQLTYAGHAYEKHPRIAGHNSAKGSHNTKNLTGEQVVRKYTTNGIAVRNTSDPYQIYFLDPNMSGHAVKVNLGRNGGVFSVDFVGP
ncbi:MAG: hypothetical protein KJZ54_10810 [Phycisphaerales bacterium]|nr:hypothetical protein [Phycisphaerales bacterium]